jgi:hypothetical protein
LSEEIVMACFNLAIDLAPTTKALTEWGGEHTDLINAQPDPVFHHVQARYAQRGAELKETC